MSSQPSKVGKRKIIIFASIAGILLGGVGSIFLLGVLRPKTAGILIETNTEALVFVDGKRLGKTPLDTTLSPHEAVVRLIPNNSQLSAYETRVNLSAGIKTILRRNFGQTEAASSGEIISFEKSNEALGIVSVVTDPDGARVFLDGRAVGFAPIKLTNIVAGNHKVAIEYPSSGQRSFNIKVIDGYNLIAVIKLASVPGTSTSTLGQETQKAVPQVEVLKPPQGYLKAREAPSTVSIEVGQVIEGLKYNLISKSSDSEWYEVDLGGGKSGWISALYATVSGELK